MASRKIDNNSDQSEWVTSAFKILEGDKKVVTTTSLSFPSVSPLPPAFDFARDYGLLKKFYITLIQIEGEVMEKLKKTGKAIYDLCLS